MKDITINNGAALRGYRKAASARRKAVTHKKHLSAADPATAKSQLCITYGTDYYGTGVEVEPEVAGDCESSFTIPWGSYRPTYNKDEYTVTLYVKGAFYLYHAGKCRNHGDALLKALLAGLPDEAGIAKCHIIGLCTYEDCVCGGSVHMMSLSVPVAGCPALDGAAQPGKGKKRGPNSKARRKSGPNGLI